MKLLKTMVILSLVVGLLLGGVLPVLADTGVTSTQPTLLLKPEWGKGRWALGKVQVIRGEVTSVGTDEIVVGDESIIVDGTKYKVPTLGKEADLDDIQVGMWIVALVYEKENELYARHIVVIPGKPQFRHHVGEVTAYVPGESITIQPRKGDAVEFQIIDELKVRPRDATVEVGDWVTVISRRDPVNDSLIARAVVVHPGIPWLGLERVSGTISDITNTTIIIDGTEVTYNDETIFVLRGVLAVEEEQEAIIFYREQEEDTLLAKLVLVGIDLPAVRAALGKLDRER